MNEAGVMEALGKSFGWGLTRLVWVWWVGDPTRDFKFLKRFFFPNSNNLI